MFSTVLPEVVSHHILSFLLLNDLLRLRRVSRVSKNLVDDYLRVYGASERVTKINLEEDLNDLTRFLALTYPINLTRFDLLNRKNSTWGSGHMRLFLDLYGEKITHLKISRLAIPMKSLLWTFLDECSNHLERLYVPDEALTFEWVKGIVDRRHRENPDTPNLKYLDLKEFLESISDDENADTYARSFYELVTTCSAHSVKLQNVDARLIEAMMKLDTPDRGLHGDKISRCVESLKKLTTSVFILELPLLEKIQIWCTSCCFMPLGDFEAPPWSNLKELILRVDSEFLDVYGGGEEVEVSSLFEFLFHGIRRENLKSLNLYLRDYLPYPNMASVCSSCPNLKKLHISCWPGSNRDIAQLWGNLPLLEDVTFVKCKNLSDAAFIGDDDTKPAIWKATRLRSLTLDRLEKVSGVTDALFRSALRHMTLKNLHLGSGKPVSSFTLEGLESLLTSKFALSIEEFPLKRRIKLEDVTDEQLAELEGMFRSSQM